MVQRPKVGGEGSTHWTKAGVTVITLEEVLDPVNLLMARDRVMANKGAPGVDGMTFDKVHEHFQRHGESICEHIRQGRYIPSPVRRVDIPKPNGGTRMLGIPTVQDRVIQQAIAQVLVRHYDPTFSEFSYGFREGRGAEQAITQTTAYIKDERSWIVEMDLEKFFDTVNHDRLMGRLEKDIKDRMLLRLIRRYLRTGILENGLVSPRDEGTPQGSPLSPILSLIVLDELDKYLEKRGIAFCRYADDCNLYMKSKKAGERALENTTRFIEETLKLRVNRSKSGVFRPSKTKFLGFTFVGTTGEPRAHEKSLKRLKEKLKVIFYRARGSTLKYTICKLSRMLRGWQGYYSADTRIGVYRDLDIHIRRHLRKLIWIAWKKPKTKAAALIKRGIAPERAWKSSVNGRGAWWNAGALHMRHAYNNDCFRKLGLYSLELRQ